MLTESKFLKGLMIEVLKKDKIDISFNVDEETLISAVHSECFRLLKQIKLTLDSIGMTNYQKLEDIKKLFELYKVDKY